MIGISSFRALILHLFLLPSLETKALQNNRATQPEEMGEGRHKADALGLSNINPQPCTLPGSLLCRF